MGRDPQKSLLNNPINHISYMVLTPSNFQNSEIPHVMFHLFKSVSTIKGDSTMKKDKDIFSYISSKKLNYEV